MIEADHHPSLHVDFGKFLPKLASYVNYLFAECLNGPYSSWPGVHVEASLVTKQRQSRTCVNLQQCSPTAVNNNRRKLLFAKFTNYL